MRSRVFFKYIIISIILCALFFCSVFITFKSKHINFPEDELALSEVESHLRFIASDELMGRKPGTYGADIAARYIAEQFRTAGLRAFSGAPDYFQVVHLDLRNESDNATNKGETRSIISKNVIGCIEGKDPNMKNEFVLMCAHYDHLGAGHFQGATDTDIIF
ncbi:MAG: M28 family peptidase, partial [Chitinivibrionales bacterium]|nr:M28 family peptidase [Chitinivibrionales bacterium]